MLRPTPKLASIALLGALAAQTFAQPGTKTQIDIKARVKGTGPWLDVVNVTAGLSDPVDIEIGVFYFRNAGYGFSGANHNIVTYGWTAGDIATLIDRPDSEKHPDGRQSVFNFGAQSQDAYTTGNDSGTLRVAASGNSADTLGGGVSTKQGNPVAMGSSFNTEDGFLGFRFDLRIVNPTPGTSNTRTISSYAPKVASYNVYNTSTSLASSNILGSLMPSDGATVSIVWRCQDFVKIIQNPSSQSASPGQTATFSVIASGKDLRYYWLKNGGDMVDSGRITGTHLPTLSIANVQPGDQASYSCGVYNSCERQFSASANLTCSPRITQQPPPTAPLRAGTVLAVGVPTGSSQTFRWRRNKQDLFNTPGLFSGVTTKSMTILSEDPSIPGVYDCVLTNSCGSVATTTTTIFCPSDFNHDGFSTGDDFDAFVAAFIRGSSTADFDHNGFVTGDDFDAFVFAFESGC